MKDKINVTIIIPVYKDLDMMKQCVKSLFDNIGESKYNLNVFIYSQGYTTEEKNELNDAIGFPEPCIHVGVDKYPEPIKFSRIISDAIIESNNYFHSDFFIGVDSDFLFKKGSFKKYDQAIDYLLLNDQCGVVWCSSFLGGSQQGDDIIPFWGGFPWRDRGLVFRNMEQIFPLDFAGFIHNDLRDITGLFDEQMSIWTIAKYGFYPAKQMNNPTLHRRNTALNAKKREGGMAALDSDHYVIVGEVNNYLNNLLGTNYDVNRIVELQQLNMFQQGDFQIPNSFTQSYIDAANKLFGYCQLEREPVVRYSKYFRK